MKRYIIWLVLGLVVISPALWGASVSQQTRGNCSPAVVDVKGNVTITCTGIGAAELNKLVELFNSSVQLTKEFYQKTLETLAKKQLSPEEIQAITALRYRAIFASAEEDAERWGKRLDSASDRQSDIDSLAAEGKNLAETISLKWQPVYDFILKIFDDRALELDKRGLLKRQGNPANYPFRAQNLDLVVVDRNAGPRVWIRDVRFPNGAAIWIYITQGQVHRGRFLRQMRLWIEERVNGVEYMPLNMFFDMKMVTFSHRNETGAKSLPGDGYPWENDPLNSEQFRKNLSLAIGQSLEFIYMHDRSPTK
jgi:hypothetical protein